MHSIRSLYAALFILLLPLGVAAQTPPNPPQQNQFEYDVLGRLSKQTDGAAQSWQYSWDAFGRILQQTNPLGQSNRYSYDGRPYPLTIEAANGALTTFHTDALGRTHLEAGPDRGQLVTTYDAADNAVVIQDARGVRIETSFDALNRPLTRSFRLPDGTVESTYQYEWDSAPAGQGRLARISTPANSISFGYNEQGQLSSRTYTRAAISLGVTRSYDAATAKPLSLSYPSGALLSYSYDTSGQLSALQWEGAALISNILYVPFGPPSSFQLGNGVVHLRAHDTARRITAYTLGGQTVHIRYDAASQIVGLEDGLPPGLNSWTQGYSYDAAGRLTGRHSEVVGEEENYQYDANGNRLSRGGSDWQQTYTYSPNSNRLIQIDDQQLHYDEAGNQIKAGQDLFTYDATGRLTAYQGALGQAQYEYNGLGERVWKQVGANGRHFVYDDNGQLLGEYRADGRPIAEYAWLGGLPIAMRQYSDTTPALASLYFIESDHLGTPRLITDATQQPRWRWRSAPFGDTLADENPAGAGAITFNLRFPGQYFDQETNTHYNYYRDYNPLTGRYIQSDPIGLDGGINLYLYANANSLSYTDAEGLNFLKCLWQRSPAPPADFCAKKYPKCFVACVNCCAAMGVHAGLCRGECGFYMPGDNSGCKPEGISCNENGKH